MASKRRQGLLNASLPQLGASRRSKITHNEYDSDLEVMSRLSDTLDNPDTRARKTIYGLAHTCLRLLTVKRKDVTLTRWPEKQAHVFVRLNFIKS